MTYKKIYNSPLGKILLIFDEKYLLELYLENQKEFEEKNKDKELKSIDEKNLDISSGEYKILRETEKWLEIYFSGKDPDFIPPIKAKGSEFRKDAWEFLIKYPRRLF